MQEILLRAAEIDPETSHFTKKFAIDKRRVLDDAACRCAEYGDHLTVMYMRDFGVIDPALIEEIAQTLLGKGNPAYFVLTAFDYGNEELILRLINFVTPSPHLRASDLAEVFKKLSPESCYRSACSLAQKGAQVGGLEFSLLKLTDPEEIASLARLLASNSSDAPFALQQFGITDRCLLDDLSRLCADASSETPQYIDHFDIKTPAILYDVAKRCAETPLEALIENLEGFYPLEQAERLELAMICANNSPATTAEYLHCFALTSRADVDSV